MEGLAGMYLSIKRKRQLIRLTYHGGVISSGLVGTKLAVAINSSGLFNLFALLLIAHILTFRLISVSRWIEEKMITEATCLSCGTAISLVGTYRCGCGFISYKERHVFSPCPMCGKFYLWVTCPACETSIPI